MDQLSKILEATHLRGSLIATMVMAGDWHVHFEQWVGAPTHYVVEGEAILEREGEPPLLLSAGDLVMFPQWDRHRMRSPDATFPAISIREVVASHTSADWKPGEWLDDPLILHVGDGGSRRTVILSIVFELDPVGQHPLLQGIPSFVHLAGQDGGLGLWLPSLLQFMTNEAGERAPGYAVMSSRIADLIFMHIIRTLMLQRPSGVTGLALALLDPAIGNLLQAIHERPGGAWTLASMARVACLSRSAFSVRFKERTGITPYAYLRSVRLEHAAAQLRRGKSLKEVIADTGYATPYAFSTAFTVHFGVPPGRFRNDALKVGISHA